MRVIRQQGHPIPTSKVCCEDQNEILPAGGEGASINVAYFVLLKIEGSEQKQGQTESGRQ